MFRIRVLFLIGIALALVLLPAFLVNAQGSAGTTAQPTTLPPTGAAQFPWGAVVIAIGFIAIVAGLVARRLNK